ncbi:MAG TPA: hypothetical protein DIT99_32040 [Candidatus Latescibacteria bacterium]|nr:hypothetical protein [Candidatus Latescibacterota bacterium]
MLSQDGALAEGAVASFESDTTVRELSTNARLKITYTADAAGDRPECLFLKIVHTDMDKESPIKALILFKLPIPNSTSFSFLSEKGPGG